MVSIVFNRIPSLDRITGKHYFRFFTYTLLVFLVFGGRFRSAAKIIRNFFPLILMTTVFENLGDVVTMINPHYADQALIRIDKFLFGGDASLWMQQFYTPWLSNLMHSAYTSYYFLPPLVAMVLYLTGQYRNFRNFMVAVTFTGFIGYIGYVLVPAIGPRFTLAHLYTKDLKTGYLVGKMVEIINNYEPYRADCFPSLHTAHTLVAMIFSFRYLSKYFSIPVNILGGLLIISTMYGRYHYAIDVVAGIGLAVFNVAMASRVNRFWYEKVFYDNWENHYPEKIKWSRIKDLFRFFRKKN
ncbi:MAG: phosphatase PAP2 family protein [bacterium]|nr:phosphatase PAP2 family protein [bacterium]